VAEGDGAVIAAIALTSGAVRTDPSKPSAHAARLLRKATTACCAKEVTSNPRERCVGAGQTNIFQQLSTEVRRDRDGDA
jgi:hypothetical protein